MASYNLSMATFKLPPTCGEQDYPPHLDDPATLRVFAWSVRRSPLAVAHSFLCTGFRDQPRDKPMYHLQSLPNGVMQVTFVNPIDALLLYDRCYHCGGEGIVFTRDHPDMEDSDMLPECNFLHLLRFHGPTTNNAGLPSELGEACTLKLLGVPRGARGLESVARIVSKLGGTVERLLLPPAGGDASTIVVQTRFRNPSKVPRVCEVEVPPRENSNNYMISEVGLAVVPESGVASLHDVDD